MTNRTALTTGETQNRLNGKPFIMGNHVLERASQMWWSDDGTFDGNDISDETNYPAEGARDRDGGQPTRPTSAVLSLSEVAFVFELPQSGLEIDKFNASLILGSNFHEFSGCTVRVDITESNSGLANDFAGTLHGWQWVASSSPWNDGRRLCGLVTTTGARQNFDYGRWGRVLVTLASGTFATAASVPTIPHFTELWLGRTRHLSWNPIRPYAKNFGRTDAVYHKSESGFITRYDRYTGQAIHRVTLQAGGDDPYGHDQNEELEEWWWNDSEGGKPSVFFANTYNPNADNSDSHPYIVMPPTDFELPFVGPLERVQTFEFEETAPFYRQEVPL